MTEILTDHCIRGDNGSGGASRPGSGDISPGDSSTAHHVLERASHAAVDQHTDKDRSDHTHQHEEKYRQSNSQYWGIKIKKSHVSH